MKLKRLSEKVDPFVDEDWDEEEVVVRPGIIKMRTRMGGLNKQQLVIF